MEDMIFQLRFSAKQLERFSKKAEKDQRVQQDKVKKALQQNNIEGARIYAENAIRKKNESLNYLRMSSRVDATAARVQSAMTMNQVARSIGGVTKALEAAMASLDLEKMAKIMDKFEQEFVDLDVRTQVMEGSMSSATTLTTPHDQVDKLIQQVADENGLDIMGKLAEVQPGSSALTASKERTKNEENELSKRLAALRE